MFAPLRADELLRRKRELRTRIGRSRRKIDNRLQAVGDHARQLVSWRAYVVHYPAWAMVAALGAGLAASATLRPGRVARWLGFSLVRHAVGEVRREVLDELRRIWASDERSS